MKKSIKIIIGIILKNEGSLIYKLIDFLYYYVKKE